VTLSITDDEHNNALHCAECRDLFIFMLRVIEVNVNMLSVVMLDVVMVNVIMLSVAAPYSLPVPSTTSKNIAINLPF
jgi:hypothetical protein